MAIEYNFKYMPLVGKLSGKSMAEQTETAINEIAKIVNDNTAQAEIINTLAEEANANSVEALEKANEALETSGRVYIKETGAVNLNDYCESQLIYINNIFSQNLPVESKGFLEVKTNDDKTEATQVFIDDTNKEVYTRSGAITETTVGDVTTYTASYSAWNKATSTNYVENMVLIRQNSTAYSVGDIARSTSLASYMLLECTSAGTTGASEPSFAGVDVGDVITDGSVSWTIIKYASTEYVREEIRQHANMPIGYEYFTFNPNIPQGSLPLFGGEYSRETYADLWAWVQTQTGYLKTEAQWQALSTANAGNVPYYSDGDGSTTFRVPSLKCWVKGANGTVSEVGSYLAAGLPNITGGFDVRGVTNTAVILNGSGACSIQDPSTSSQSINIGTAVVTPSYGKCLSIDASRSSSIYGNANTVVPESIVGMWLVKAYGVIVDTGTIDEQQYIDDRFAAAKDYTDMEVATGVPTGCVQAFAGQTTPTGWLLCDGSAVNRVTYAKLFSVIGTSYGAGDGSTTFNVPNLIDRFVQGNATAGTVKAAGLPNITGSANVDPTGGTTACPTRAYNGAITKVGNTAVRTFTYSGTVTSDFGIKLDASLSNSIYGNSTTVQPPALTMRYIIKY